MGLGQYPYSPEIGAKAGPLSPRFRGSNSLIQLPSAYALGYSLTPSGLSENARLAPAGNVQLPFQRSTAVSRIFSPTSPVAFAIQHLLEPDDKLTAALEPAS